MRYYFSLLWEKKAPVGEKRGGQFLLFFLESVKRNKKNEKSTLQKTNNQTEQKRKPPKSTR